MADKRPKFVTFVIFVNVFFGTMLLISAAILITFKVFGIGNNDKVALLAGLFITAGILGISSGVSLLKEKRPAAGLAIAFSVLLLCIEGLLFYEDNFSPVIGSLKGLYAVASAGYFVDALFKRHDSPPTAKEEEPPGD